MSLTKVKYSMVSGSAKSFSGYSSFNQAISSIGSDNVLLIIDAPAFVNDGTTLTVPSNVAVLIQPGFNISRASGGSSTTTVIFDGPLETYDGVFPNLNWRVTNSFIFHGDYADIDTSRFTFPGESTSNKQTTFGNVNLLSGSGQNTKLIPGFVSFPSTQFTFCQNREGTEVVGQLTSHSKAVDGWGGGSLLFQMNKMALYTRGTTSAVKRWDLDTGATDNTSLWSNQKATIFRGSSDVSASQTCLMVNTSYPEIVLAGSSDIPTYRFNPNSSTAYNASGAVIRKEGTNRTMVLCNRNAVTGDVAGLTLSLDNTANEEQQMARIEVTGVEQASPNYQGRLDFYTRFQSDYKTNLSMTRDSVAVNNPAGNASALEISAKDDGVSFLMIGYNKSKTVQSFTATSQTGALGNSAQSVFRVGTSASTGRSINAGGTINASGSDYAEYMEKAGDFIINKGDICGIDANGKLTNVFSDAVSFVVKSTEPSYVGNDAWSKQFPEPVEPNFVAPVYSGSPNPGEKPIFQEPPTSDTYEKDFQVAMEEWHSKVSEWQLLKDQHDEDKRSHAEHCLAAENMFKNNEYAKYKNDLAEYNRLHEEQRLLMDRIAFCGQVPVNVTGATSGQYIVPINDNGSITGEAISNPTFEQYQIAVGKVIAIEDDGRAKIIVKIS